MLKKMLVTGLVLTIALSLFGCSEELQSQTSSMVVETTVSSSESKSEATNTTNSTSLQVAEPAKMLATGNPIAYLIAVIMVIFGSIWIPNRKR